LSLVEYVDEDDYEKENENVDEDEGEYEEVNVYEPGRS
jgi:hypothetical protein